MFSFRYCCSFVIITLNIISAMEIQENTHKLSDMVMKCGRDLADFVFDVCSDAGIHNVKPSDFGNNGFGLDDECCRKSCLVEDIFRYCSNYHSDELFI
ncbi:hypothetical protein KQX54_005776 [Cotesia glomerata]|uniref:Insulin-like domain-containing protein n=1 Tax=Cotesia glomerata TaxID=32391 RepID=A0AAV7HVS1_COTGL|nr:hypothetical protein KQX54_005776 [Cotesia glomerata]